MINNNIIIIIKEADATLSELLVASDVRCAKSALTQSDRIDFVHEFRNKIEAL
jgi:hypothetical protein